MVFKDKRDTTKFGLYSVNTCKNIINTCKSIIFSNFLKSPPSNSVSMPDFQPQNIYAKTICLSVSQLQPNILNFSHLASHFKLYRRREGARQEFGQCLKFGALFFRKHFLTLHESLIIGQTFK